MPEDSAHSIWTDALRDHWGIDATLRKLEGEYDLNFRVITASGYGYILKVMRKGCDPALVEMQAVALSHVAEHGPDLPLPRVIVSQDKALWITVRDKQGGERLAWLQNALPGRCYARFNPKSTALIQALGYQAGRLDAVLRTFRHEALKRDLKWNLMQASWVEAELDVVESSERRALLKRVCSEFAALRPVLDALPPQAIHNDLNDYNILVDIFGVKPGISGLIDLGDMCSAPRICDLAIAAAYVVLDSTAPEDALAALVAGYHSANPLTAVEIDLLWPLLRMRLATSVINSTIAARASPDDPYVTISQAPAWRLLESRDIEAEMLRYRLRTACGLPISDAATRISEWLAKRRGSFASVIGASLSNAPTVPLSVASSTTPRDPFDITLEEAATLDGDRFGSDDVWLGFYGEPRLIYTAPAFRQGRWKASDRRTVHLGIDVFAPAGTELRAPLPATVLYIENRKDLLDYGGMVILRHVTPEGDVFFTLYGHLDPDSCASLQEGRAIAANEVFAQLGKETCNGGWAPHLHFQLALTLAGMGTDWPGVANPDDMAFWGAICPNPAALLNLEDANVAHVPEDKARIKGIRGQHFGGNLKLSYDDPVMFLRGWRHHLFDEWGRPYLDAYNNVPHVGHAHPRIQAVVADQLLRMNSNTRYLHPAQTAFAEKLLSKLPPELSVCWFVNSGSEANELALRLARAASGGRAIITSDHGYHGNTTGAIDISAYKFNALGGVGRPDWVQLVDTPDDYRGAYRRDNAQRGMAFATQIDEALKKIQADGQKLAGFIAETFPSVGGQIIPPPGYLQSVYDRIRAAGGLCIADEVQTGLGRLGSHYFAFEAQGVLPDIVVLGKPIGNGHPIGVAITTPQIAAAFAQGPEFFSTFGGSTLSCRVGKAVLDIVDDEGLMENASVTGKQLLDGLHGLAGRHAIIGDIRGMGLFLGVELVTNRESLEPATQVTSYVVNRMREKRILIGCEGPYENIIKIRPPLTIDSEDVWMILESLDLIFAEAGAMPIDTSM